MRRAPALTGLRPGISRGLQGGRDGARSIRVWPGGAAKIEPDQPETETPQGKPDLFVSAFSDQWRAPPLITSYSSGTSSSVTMSMISISGLTAVSSIHAVSNILTAGSLRDY